MGCVSPDGPGSVYLGAGDSPAMLSEFWVQFEIWVKIGTAYAFTHNCNIFLQSTSGRKATLQSQNEILNKVKIMQKTGILILKQCLF